MKKYNLLNKISIAVLGFFMVTSCGDDFVDNAQLYSIDSETYFNTEEEYNEALIAAYDLLQSSYVNVLLGEIASDNTLSGGESANDVIGYQQVDEMTHSSQNQDIRNIWNFMFAGVQRSSYILEFKDKTDFEGKARIIAEARFLRAYYHFELVKWFGGIPLKGDARFKLGDETTIPRSSVSDVYKSIEDDLKLAIVDLPIVASQTGRATKGSAQALLGKAYLYQNKFLEATQVLEPLINTSSYSLVTNYNTIFENAGENGVESVFEVQYTDSEGAGFNCLQCSEGNVAVGFNGIRNYNGPFFTSGFSFNVPTQQAYNAYEIGDNRRDVAILNIVPFAAANNATFGTGYKHTGFFNKKYLPRTRNSNAAGDLNLTNPNNYRSIRYADVLLMAAEAFNRGGISDAKARTYLNLVRRRAFGDLNHDISSSGAALTDFILTERRLELMGEGHRFFDLVRTNRTQAIPGFNSGKNELFPVPTEEIQFSNGNWQQNPGY